MARPNNGKTNERISVKISKRLYYLLLAEKDVLINDGQKRFAEIASMYDISDEFVDHFWKLASFSIGGKKMRESYQKVTKSARNI